MSSQLPAYETIANSVSDDPDEFFKNTVPVASCELQVRQMFLRKVYSLLLVQIFSSVIVGTVIFFNEPLKQWCFNNGWIFILTLIGSIGFMVGAAMKARSYPINLYFLAGFTFCEAFTVGFGCSLMESDVVVRALLLTFVIFIGLTAFAFQTKYDFTSFQGILVMSLWALLSIGFVFMFFPTRGKALELVYASIGALIFSAFIVVDTQLIMKRYNVDEEVMASITLYLDVLNLFWYIVSILNLTRDD